jgi:hypothetical protein
MAWELLSIKTGMPEKANTFFINFFTLFYGDQSMAKVQKTTDSSSLAEVVDRILDKGIVIDAWAKVSLVGIELLSVEARVVIASVETYLKYAEAIGLTAAAATPA